MPKMTDDQVIVLLMALTAINGVLRYREVYVAVYGERASRILKELFTAGVLDHPGYNDWRITEKGRIAAALLMHKDPSLADAFGLNEGDADDRL